MAFYTLMYWYYILFLHKHYIFSVKIEACDDILIVDEICFSVSIMCIISTAHSRLSFVWNTEIHVVLMVNIFQHKRAEEKRTEQQVLFLWALQYCLPHVNLIHMDI